MGFFESREHTIKEPRTRLRKRREYKMIDKHEFTEFKRRLAMLERDLELLLPLAREYDNAVNDGIEEDAWVNDTFKESAWETDTKYSEWEMRIMRLRFTLGAD